MKLPISDTPLQDLAEKKGASKSLVYDFITKGGAGFMNDLFIEYANKYLVDKDFLDGYTPVGALAVGRDIMAAILNDFVAEFDKKNPEEN